jgi:hypothetical protein
MKKVVIDAAFNGRFQISKEAERWLFEHGHQNVIEYATSVIGTIDEDTVWPDFDREDPLLIECIEALGRCANGDDTSFKIVEIPDDVKYKIERYGGYSDDDHEQIVELGRTWR